MFGSNVIVLSDKLKENKCWQRFIYTKELMHMFDSDEDSMSISDEFVELLSDLSTPTQEICSQTQSDFRGFWMALACLCPENIRLELEGKRNAKEVTDYEIALTLKLPEVYVPRLFEDRFPRIIKELVA